MKNKICLLILLFIVMPSLLFADDLIQQLDLELVLQEKEDDENYIFGEYIEYDVDNEGSIYISQMLPPTSLISKFDKNGKFLFNIGKKGMGPGEYKMPFARITPDQLLYVWDGNRIHFFKLDGTFIKTIQNRIFLGNDAKPLGDNNFIEFKHDRDKEIITLFIGNVITNKEISIISEKAEYTMRTAPDKRVVKSLTNYFKFSPGSDGLIVFHNKGSETIKAYKDGKISELFNIKQPDSGKCDIMDIIVDNKSDIWILYNENRKYYIARYSTDGKLKEKYSAYTKDEFMAYTGGIHFIGDYMYIKIYNGETGNKIYRTKIY